MDSPLADIYSLYKDISRRGHSKPASGTIALNRHGEELAIRDSKLYFLEEISRWVKQYKNVEFAFADSRDNDRCFADSIARRYLISVFGGRLARADFFHTSYRTNYIGRNNGTGYLASSQICSHHPSQKARNGRDVNATEKRKITNGVKRGRFREAIVTPANNY